MKDYTYLYAETLSLGGEWGRSWDVFVSAYNESDRVRRVYGMVRAKEKHWVVHGEYGYEKGGVDLANAFWNASRDEAEFVLGFLEERVRGVDWSKTSICVDATGFMRPHLMFLLRLLFERGADVVDILYSEPEYYKRQERTVFSEKYVEEVRQVAGFEGTTGGEKGRDILVIGAGYESHLMTEVAEVKDDARKIVLLGLPSLRADMYQQSVLQTQRARDALGEGAEEKYFAPIGDPFGTATVVSEIVARERAGGAQIGHIYLAPLATKAQAVGFALFYLAECRETNTSIIFPFSEFYERETSVGLSRVRLYRIEFKGLG